MTAASGSPSGGPLARDGTVVVVGSSLAGVRSAEALRSEGFTGRLVVVGEETHLPYDRPPLSKQVLAGAWEPERARLLDPARPDELGLELHLGRRATSLDVGARRVVLEDGLALTADAVVVATGAAPRELPGTAGDEHVTVLRTLDHALALRRGLQERPGARVVVVGAGFIGSEVASTCSGLGGDVTVVEAMSTPLAPVVGAQVGSALAALHERNGVRLRTGVGVSAVRPGRPEGGAPRQVELSDGTVLAADVVVVGIGVRPATQWLEGSGLTLDDGVVCDRALFAADGVVAVGDLARWRWCHHGVDELVRIEHWQTAADGALTAARNLLRGREAAMPFDPMPYFWSDQYGMKIQMLGRPSPDDEVAVVDGSLSDERFVVLYGRDDRLTGVLGVSRARALMSFRPLLVAGASWDEALAHARP